MAFQSTVSSTHVLTHRPRPYGVEKKLFRFSARSTSVGESLNAIDGRFLMISNVQNVFRPARKLGWPQETTSVTSGSARQSLRVREKTGRSKRSVTTDRPWTTCARRSYRQRTE